MSDLKDLKDRFPSNSQGLYDNDLVEGEDEDESDVLMCWLSMGRICGSDCAAFDLRSLSDKSALSTCLLLNTLRVGATAAMKLVTDRNKKPESGVD